MTTPTKPAAMIMNRLALVLLVASSCCFKATEAGEKPAGGKGAPKTGVTFSCDDAELKKLFDAAEKTCRRNVRSYGSMRILVEGGQYNGMWLETQPMGGYMWGKRDLQVAANNFLKFIEFQPKSGHWAGKLPYRVINNIPRDHDKLQGYCWPQPSWELYHALGRDKAFLRAVYDAMVGHDAWLWKNRDADGNGCLENRGHDTGEDGTTRFRYGTPYESMDVNHHLLPRPSGANPGITRGPDSARDSETSGLGALVPFPVREFRDS